jgi:hypothetical protein
MKRARRVRDGYRALGETERHLDRGDEEAPVEGWIDELAAELGEDRLTQDEVVRLLGVAREVAHRVERKTTPLAAFLLGTAIGRAEASGMDRARAMDGVFGTLERILPEAPPDDEDPVPATPSEAADARGEVVPPGEGNEDGTLDR